jgi:flagellar L-ring protein precursor FlgH
MKNYSKTIKNIALTALCATALSACSAADRLANVGEPPQLTAIENPVDKSNYRPVSMPMPDPVLEKREANSLWSTGRQAFFKDQRANSVGDILTVVIDIEDEASLTNTSQRSRSSAEDADLPALLGYEQALNKVLPEAIDNTDLTQMQSSSSSQGSGSTEREEEIDMKVAAVITQVLPNGNFVIVGRQEVRVNFEKRVLEVAGVIRPEDISINNTIPYEQIAEARIAYGGKGQITDVQQPRYGQQVYDILFPF